MKKIKNKIKVFLQAVLLLSIIGGNIVINAEAPNGCIEYYLDDHYIFQVANAGYSHTYLIISDIRNNVGDSITISEGIIKPETSPGEEVIGPYLMQTKNIGSTGPGKVNVLSSISKDEKQTPQYFTDANKRSKLLKKYLLQAHNGVKYNSINLPQGIKTRIAMFFMIKKDDMINWKEKSLYIKVNAPDHNKQRKVNYYPVPVRIQIKQKIINHLIVEPISN